MAVCKVESAGKGASRRVGNYEVYGVRKSQTRHDRVRPEYRWGLWNMRDGVTTEFDILLAAE